MLTDDENMKEAEAFIRKALSRFRGRNATQRAIKKAAYRVTKSLPDVAEASADKERAAA